MAGGIANHFDAWRLIWGGVPAAMIATGVLMLRERPVPGGFKRWFMQGGDASYALYLSHPFVLSALALVCAKAGLSDGQLYIGVAFVACVAFSGVFYRKCERPFQQLAQTWFSPQRRGVLQQPAHRLFSSHSDQAPARR